MAVIVVIVVSIRLSLLKFLDAWGWLSGGDVRYYTHTPYSPPTDYPAEEGLCRLAHSCTRRTCRADRTICR